MIDITLLLAKDYNMPDIKLVDIEKSLKFFSIQPFFEKIDKSKIKKRYRELIKEYHPDKHPDNIEWYNDMMQRLNEAYDLVINNISYINNLVTENLQKEKKTEEISVYQLEKKCVEIDSLMEDAILLGWLQRLPRDHFAIDIRNQIKGRVELLLSPYALKIIEKNKRLDFFTTLSSVFLRATELKGLRKFPIAQNSTKFLRHFSIANRYLDSGIRSFYRNKHKGMINKYKNISLSYLDDSKRLHSYLIPQSNDTQFLKIIKARIELADLFQMRITIKSLWGIKQKVV